MNGTKAIAVREVPAQLEGMIRNPNLDTIPKKIWDHVRSALAVKGITHRQFATALATQFCGSTMWKHAPNRTRLHRVAAVLEGQEIHTVATDDVFWDTVVEIASVGEQDVFDGTVTGTHNFVANGITLHNSLEQDSDVVILLHRPDLFEQEDSDRLGEADLIIGKHRNGPTKTVRVAHQLHFSRFTNMAKG